MIRNLLWIGAVLALMACGSSEPDKTSIAEQPAAATATAPVAAAPPAAPAPPAAEPAIPSSDAAATTPPESAQCLELVGRGDFSEAVPICVRAAGIDPENAEVQQALQTAQSKAGTSAAAGMGGGSAEDAAKGAAGSLGDQMP